MLENAFEALKSYDWGTDPKTLKSIDEAVVSTHGDAAARAELEQQLAAALDTELSYDAKQFLCRKLMLVGTATCVPTLVEVFERRETFAHGALCVRADSGSGSGCCPAKRFGASQRCLEGWRDRLVWGFGKMMPV